MFTRALHTLLTHRRPLRFLLGHLSWRTGWPHRLGATFCVRTFNLHLHPANLSTQLWIDPASNDETPDLIHSLVHPGDTIIDVGANIGFTTLEAACSVGPMGCVHAVEPHPRTYSFLVENMALNPDLAPAVKTHHTALAAKAESGGTIRFTDSRHDDMNSIVADHEESSGIEVPITTLDQLFSDLPCCDLLKIDVEGLELDVLRGGSNLLQRTRQILVEVGHPNSDRFGGPSTDLLEFLVAAGFQVTDTTLERLPITSGKTVSVTDWIATKASV